MGTVRFTSSRSHTPENKSFAAAFRSAAAVASSSAAAAGASAKSKPAAKGKGKSSRHKAAAAALTPASVVARASVDDLGAAFVLAEDMLDKKLATRDKWQICTQRNLSEIRSECMKVRRQLATLSESFDGVLMQVEDGLSGYDGLKTDVRTAMKEHRRLVRSLDAQLKRLDERLTSHIETTNDQVAGLEKKLEEVEQTCFTEEDLTAQLATLQEQFEVATTETRKEYSRIVDAKFQAVETLARRAASVHELLQQRDVQDNELRQHLKAVKLQGEDVVSGIAQRVYGLEQHQERQHTDTKQLRSNTDAMRRQLDDLEKRIQTMARNQDHLYRAQNEMVIPPPAPPLAPVELEPLKEAQRYGGLLLSYPVHLTQFVIQATDLDVSPGVYLFFRLFDVVEVQRSVPQRGHFRLNARGRQVVSALWGDLLSKLPYHFFIDCSWLEAQSERNGFCRVPPLGICHLLTTLLVWHTSAIASNAPDGANVVDEIMQKCIDALITRLVIKLPAGKHRESEHDLVALDGTSDIEVVGLDTAWVALMELDGFFEVAEKLKLGPTSEK
ncbi:hypothetical protein P43SY_000573 [Pythium insidiosum]|uniref:Uncharacterized protein n=1 Tax=Pythium insidiosum TaxID=114742 RepID=A0AAD5LDE1_PYTIN|nr:hypothetical protein P43SY_000573 [Pythium insidiosum]